MTMRFFAGSMFAALVVAMLWSHDNDPDTAPDARNAGDLVVSSAGTGAPRSSAISSTVSWTSLHRGETVQASLAGFSEWLIATYPAAEPTFLGADCASPPCLIGMQFTGERLTHDEVRALLAGVPREIERRTGITMSAIHADEDDAGRHYLWMYGLPAELANDERETLRLSAEARYALRMDPLRKSSDPHVTTGRIGN